MGCSKLRSKSPFQKQEIVLWCMSVKNTGKRFDEGKLITQLIHLSSYHKTALKDDSRIMRLSERIK